MPSEKIIFLDIDGVLNVIGMHCGPRDEFGSQFHQHLVDNLAWIIEQTGASIVISSSWRHSGLGAMKLMWEMRDLPGEVIDVTPDGRSMAEHHVRYREALCRGDEIQYWLDRTPGVKYVIIDDDSDMLEIQKPYFVQTSENWEHDGHVEGYGLTRKCAERVVEILNG